jgi:hypothetical protein
MFLQNVVQCCVWHVKLSGCMTGWFAWTVNESHINCIHLSFSDWLSLKAFPFTNAASLIKQFIPFVNQHFYWQFPSKHCTKSPLHCNRRPRLVMPQHTFSIFYFRCHFNNCECSASGRNSSGTNYKVDHIKSKAVPLHTMDTHGGRGVQLLLILNLSTRWWWVVSITPQPCFTPGKEPLVPTGQEAGWVPEPVWMQRLEEKSSASVRDRTPVVQSVLSH